MTPASTDDFLTEAEEHAPPAQPWLRPEVDAAHLAGPRTVLRPYQRADAPAVWAAITESRASLARWTPDIGRRLDVTEVQAGFEHLDAARARGKRLVYGIWRQPQDTFVGEIGLHDIDWAQRTASVGYWLRLSARGQGLVDEALQALHTHAARHLGLLRLDAHIAAENWASRRVVERHGYVLQAARRADPQWDGDASSVLIYALTPPQVESD